MSSILNPASLLYLIDQFGRPVTINFSGREKFKSKFGGICTILFIGFLVWAFYNASRDLFVRDNPTTLKSETYSADPRAMILTPDSFPFSIGIQTPSALGLRPYIDDSIYTVTFRYVRRFKTMQPNGTITESTKGYILNKEPCTLSHFGKHAQNFEGVDIANTFCIAKEQPVIKEIKLQGVYASTEYEYLLALVKPCINSTSSPVICKTPETIEKYLTTGWFNALYVNMAVDPKNYTHPDARYREIYSTMMSTANYKETTFSLGHVDVTTDSGWIVSDPKKEEYIMMNKINEIVQFAPDTLRGLVFSAIFEVNMLETHHSRSYKTIQNVLAEVGGLANVALAVIFIVTLPYLRLKFCLSLINELFDIHMALPQRKKDNKKKQKKSKQKDSVALEVQSDKDNNNTEKPKSSKEIKEAKVKPNAPPDSNFANGPLFSRIPSSDSKPNKSSDRKESKNAKDVLDSEYLPLDMHSPREEKDIKQSLQVNTPGYIDTERVRILSEGQTIQEEGENPVKSRYTSESLFPPGSHFARLASQMNQNADWEVLKGEKDLPSFSSSYVPLDTVLPANQHNENNTPLDQNRNRQRRPSKSKFLRSKSSSFHEADDIKPSSGDKNPRNLAKSNVELMKVSNDKPKSMYSSTYNKQKLTQVNQKEINKREKHPDPFLISSVDEFYDPENYQKGRESGSNHDSVENEMEKIDFDSKQVPNEADKNNSLNQNPTQYAKKPQKIHITFGEYVCSFFYQTPTLKQKMDILTEGKKNIDARLDLVSILKKLREIDKLKAMLLDIDQAILFNNLPNPEIKAKELKTSANDTSFTHQLLRKPAFIDKGETASMVFDSHRKLQGKVDKTQIDQRLIAVFKEKTG